jgi:hypothetical protein
MKQKEDKKVELLLILLAMAILSLAVVSADPDPLGADITPGVSSRGADPDIHSVNAQAGNVTQLDIDQTRITDIWQGFFGNVSGQIVLENAAGNNFYDWSYTKVTGEIYATRNVVQDWTTVNCTNSTQWETEESTLNIPSYATDGINETYNSTLHPSFMVGNRIIHGCQSTRPYNSSGMPGEFWNILLNSNSTTTVYTALLADNSNGFDSTTVDFEILVPTDKDTGKSTYYFYAELN